MAVVIGSRAGLQLRVFRAKAHKPGPRPRFAMRCGVLDRIGGFRIDP
jgi:hypothetical protein